MTSLTAWRAQQAHLWGAGAWQDSGETMLAPVHDQLLRHLDPQPGECWLDAACGTGAVARRAARAGAVVAALDLAAALVQTGRDLASSEGCAITFDVGDVEQLPYPDAAFDVVASAHGVVFAADHAAVAGELARVCRRGGRLGVTFWRSNPELDDLKDRLAGPQRLPGTDRPRDWGHRDYVRALLGEAFRLDFSDQVCPWLAPSGEAAWQQFTAANGHAMANLATMPEPARNSLYADWVRYFEAHRTSEDRLNVPCPYLLILGQRR